MSPLCSVPDVTAESHTFLNDHTLNFEARRKSLIVTRTWHHPQISHTGILTSRATVLSGGIFVRGDEVDRALPSGGDWCHYHGSLWKWLWPPLGLSPSHQVIPSTIISSFSSLCSPPQLVLLRLHNYEPTNFPSLKISLFVVLLNGLRQCLRSSLRHLKNVLQWRLTHCFWVNPAVSL